LDSGDRPDVGVDVTAGGDDLLGSCEDALDFSGSPLQFFGERAQGAEQIQGVLAVTYLPEPWTCGFAEDGDFLDFIRDAFLERTRLVDRLGRRIRGLGEHAGRAEECRQEPCENREGVSHGVTNETGPPPTSSEPLNVVTKLP